MIQIEEIPRLLTAVAEWGACSLYIISLKKKIKGWKLIGMSMFWLLVQSIFLCVTDHAPIVFWIPNMIIAVCFMYLYLYSCLDLTLKDIGYCCAKAFVLAEFVAAIGWQIYIFFVIKGMSQELWFQILFCLIVFAIIYPLDYFVETRKLPKDRGIGLKPLELFNTVFIASTIFLFSNISFININTPFSGTNLQEIYYIRTLVDLCGMLLLYAQQDERQKRYLAHEMDSMNNILNNQYMQYKMSRNNLEILDQKYHDLKHQIIAIRQETDAGKRELYLSEMEKRIKMYESEFRTGYHVLDVLLNMKGSICAMHNINFTCMADGTLLNFMNTADVCSIFGNALDNAIENVQKQEDIEKRMIQLSVFSKEQLIMIKFENYCDEAPILENGLPSTTKKNKNYHGYGLKSIKMISQKYGGSMTIKTENNWFVLRILIPRPITT